MMCRGSFRRVASATAQSTARSLVGEPSTPTTMALRGVVSTFCAFSMVIFFLGTTNTDTPRARRQGTWSRLLAPRRHGVGTFGSDAPCTSGPRSYSCLLYTSDAADDLTRVDLG